MFKEMRGIEYTLEIIRACSNNPGTHDSKAIFELVVKRWPEASLTYLQKILPRMAKIGILGSSESGYVLLKPIDDIMVAEVLDLCDMPDEASPLYRLCSELKKAVSLTSINEFYDFT